MSGHSTIEWVGHKLLQPFLQNESRLEVVSSLMAHQKWMEKGSCEYAESVSWLEKYDDVAGMADDAFSWWSIVVNERME